MYEEICYVNMVLLLKVALNEFLIGRLVFVTF